MRGCAANVQQTPGILWRCTVLLSAGNGGYSFCIFVRTAMKKPNSHMQSSHCTICSSQFFFHNDIFLRSLWCDMYNHKGPKLLFSSPGHTGEGLDLIMLSICTASVGWSADQPAGLQSGLKNNFCACVNTSACTCACVRFFPLLPHMQLTHIVLNVACKSNDELQLGVQHEGHCNRCTQVYLRKKKKKLNGHNMTLIKY